MAANLVIARRILRHLRHHHRGGSHASATTTMKRLSSTSTTTTTNTTTTYGTAPSHGSPAAMAVAQASERIILPHVCDHLMRHGYAVIDGALESTRIPTAAAAAVAAAESEEGTTTLSDALLRELEGLAGTPGVMVPNATHLVQKEGTFKLEKAHILEAEVHALGDDILTTKAPTFRAVLEDRSMLTLLNVMLPPPTPHHQLHYQSVKMQLNEGADGCFPLHFDSDAAVDGRRVTALTYLNPDWAQGDGGELVLYPFPGAPVKIEPLMGRVVLFSAANMLHRVLPSKKKRLCFTTWFFAKSAAATTTAAAAADEATTGAGGTVGAGAATATATATTGKDARGGGDGKGAVEGGRGGSDVGAAGAAGAAGAGMGEGLAGGAMAAAAAAAVEEARALLQPNLRKHLMKVIFAEEWAESIAAAHPESPGRTAALDTHWREVDVIARALAGKYPEGLNLVARVSTGGSEEDKAALGVTWF